MALHELGKLQGYCTPLALTIARCAMSQYMSLAAINSSGGFLTKTEEDLCRSHGMTLPMPSVSKIPTSVDLEIDEHRLVRRIDTLVDHGPVYLVSGVFDLFHGGHWLLMQRLRELVEINQGYGMVVVEDDDYSPRYKGDENVFPAVMRAMWFRDYWFVNRVLVFARAFEDEKQNKSWSTLYALVADMSHRTTGRVRVVIPNPQEAKKKEGDALIRRALQASRYGLGVEYVSGTQLTDVSSSKLRKRLKLKALRTSQVTAQVYEAIENRDINGLERIWRERPLLIE